ncbi:MAG TPA: hypothetical protein VHZ51_13570 [Ktedonobacteraceae bacterium]|nr:hypothetical protein [Ktedonobacteraceae bacterium]
MQQFLQKANVQSFLRKPSVLVFIILLLVCVILSALSYRVITLGGYQKPDPHPSTSASAPTPTATSTPRPTATPAAHLTTLPIQPPSSVRGVDASYLGGSYPGIPWLRLSYPSCGWGDLRSAKLRSVIEGLHRKGVRVLLTFCQRGNDAGLFNPAPLRDVAQANADAVQCGNEEMKQDASVSFLYIPPDRFARFYDMCEQAVHAVRPATPVLLGSLDPHVGGVDFQPLQDQVSYLNDMQNAMNSTVHPGGNWDWHTQKLGLIDSWHNGYPDASVNSLSALFQFWADQFQVDLNSGALGQHLWVVEGTGCFKGCGIDSSSSYQVAVSHVLTLITDAQSALRYKVPFFYFSGVDFKDQGYFWPIGILDSHGHSKPIRQDLSMGARSLTMSCPKPVKVVSQEQLLAKLYAHCALPSDAKSILTN